MGPWGRVALQGFSAFVTGRVIIVNAGKGALGRGLTRQEITWPAESPTTYPH